MRKTRNNTKYSQPIAWIDLIFNIMMSFAFLFVLSYILINVVSKKEDMKKPKAEMLINMTWPDYAVEDIDLWLKLPSGGTVSFRGKEANLIALEHDDRGLMSDWVQDSTTGNMVVNPANKEIITFRGLPPGRYQISVHYYSAMSGTGSANNKIVPPTPPYPVKIEVIKLNPTVQQLFVKDITVEHVGEEVPVVSFTIGTEGSEVKDFSTDDVEKFIPVTIGNGENQP